MANESQPTRKPGPPAGADPVQPSFSPRRRLTIAVDVFLRTLVVLGIVVMVNYLSHSYFQRHFLSAQTRIELSPRTVGLLRSLTNHVKVTLYFNKEDQLYPMVTALLNEYRNVNPRIQVVTVDYNWDAAEAQKIKTAYKLGEAADERSKNLVIFDCEGRPKVVNANTLAEFKLEQVDNETEREFRRRLTSFNGERSFTEALLTVTHPKPFRAVFLQGHGEHRLNSGDEVTGYLGFASVLQNNYVECEPISLLGTNTIPADCNLLIIAGPTAPISEEELEKISRYLDQGGRLFALLNSAARDRQSGLERILIRWGVLVGDTQLQDPANSLKGADIVIGAFSRHPVTNPLIGSYLNLILPRPVSPVAGKDSASAPRVEVLAATEETAVIAGDPTPKPKRHPVAVAVEKGAVPGVATQRVAARLVVVGDSYFLANKPIQLLANRDFAAYAVNWLLDRPHLLEGIGPQPVTEFRVVMTRAQMQTVQWILLGAMPGAVAVLGALVWLRRRK